MKMQAVKEIAMQKGLQPTKMKKTELIRTIQKQEGNSDCFASAYSRQCSQDDCLWRDDCIKMN
jgi:hypothetical protein